MDFVKQMGKNIAAARKDAGFSTRESLAEAIGVATSTVTRWEQGKFAPKPPQQKALESILGMDYAQLINYDKLKGFQSEKIKTAESDVINSLSKHISSLADQVEQMKKENELLLQRLDQCKLAINRKAPFIHPSFARDLQIALADLAANPDEATMIALRVSLGLEPYPNIKRKKEGA